MNTSAKLPVTVLCGFLGCGKTTLLRSWRRDEAMRGAARPEARDAFASSLRDALCTPEEVAAWQRGETFNDPWPKNVRTIS